MIKKLTGLIVAAWLIFGMVLPAHAAGTRGMQRMERGDRPFMNRHMRMGLEMVEHNLFPPRMLLRMSHEIGLTEDQVAKLRRMDLAYQERMVKQEAEMRIQGLKLRSLFDAAKVDRNAVEKAIRAMSRMRTDFQVERINHLLDIRDLLTPDQIARIDAGKRQSRRHMWLRRHRPDRPAVPDTPPTPQDR